MLVALVVAMTVGAFALLLLDTDPIRPSEAYVAIMNDRHTGASAAIDELDVPISPVRWHNIVILSSAAGPKAAEGCHFVIEPGGAQPIHATPLWRRQADGRHTFVREFNGDSIGICLKGDFSAQPPSEEQFGALVALVRALQAKLSIYPDQIFLHSELDGRSNSPGPAFPAQALAARLVR